MNNLKQQKPYIKKIADNIKDYLPVFSLLIVIIGIIQQYIYYRLFDFNILPFLDLSSLTINFINNFFLSIIMVMSVLLFDFLVNHINHRLPLVILIVVVLCLTSSYFIFFTLPNNPLDLLNISCLILLILIGCSLLRFAKLHFEDTGRNILFSKFMKVMSYIAFIGIITIVPIHNSIFDQENILQNRSCRNYTLVGEHFFLRAFDENKFVIGQTATNYFIYNKNNFSVTILDKSEVNKVVVYKLN